ncbi:MAG TPA: glycosyltransferase [Chloroflexi bacterium]|nr:glycosyltransferase [Chloroflexota bacterium]
MRVCNPTPFRAAGGGFYFMRNFERYLEAHGHTVTRSLADRYDVLLVNSWQVDYDHVLEAIRRNPRVRIVHRVDGSSQDYGRGEKGDRRQGQVNRFADLTIFQSAYCRHSTREKFPVIGSDGPVIHNAVDVEHFSPQGERADLPGEGARLGYVTYSTNPMKGWRDVYTLAGQHPDLTFILIGRYESPPDLPNLHVLGPVPHEELPRMLRACDVFLAFQRNEACPNVVLEAMACGLPILYAESGATPELVGPCGLPVTVENFREQLEWLLSRREELAACARGRAVALFHPDRVFGAYVEQIEATLRRPLGWRGVRRWLWAWAVKIGRPLKMRLPGR